MFSLATRLARNSGFATSLVRGVTTTRIAKSVDKEPADQPIENASSSSSLSEAKAVIASLRARVKDEVDALAEPLSVKPAPKYESARFVRKFHPKSVYHPSQLVDNKHSKQYRKTLDERPAPKDPFLALGIDPLKHYKNTTMLSHFITEMGKIKPRKKSLLSAKSQNRVAKAIKRGRAFGLLPLTNKPQSTYNNAYVGRGSVGN